MQQVVEPIRSKKDIKMVEKYLIERNFRNYVIFVFGINTGLRISDILFLMVDKMNQHSQRYMITILSKQKKRMYMTATPRLYTENAKDITRLTANLY